LTDYLLTPPSPLAEAPLPYTRATIRALFAALQPFALTKAELLMILNVRPTTAAALDVVVEEADMRFSAHEQEDLLRRIVQVLGGGDSGADADADADGGEGGDEADADAGFGANAQGGAEAEGGEEEEKDGAVYD
jgi:hypothetical protein